MTVVGRRLVGALALAGAGLAPAAGLPPLSERRHAAPQLLGRRVSNGFVGLDNYRFIIENPKPLVGRYALGALQQLAVADPVHRSSRCRSASPAVLTSRVRYEAVAKSAIFIPMAISFVAASVIWRFMYEFNPDIGTVNAVVTAARRRAHRLAAGHRRRPDTGHGRRPGQLPRAAAAQQLRP